MPILAWALGDNGAAMRLFVYGSLMRGEPNHRLLDRARFLGPATTAPRFELADLGPYPALVGGGETAVAGELYAVGPQTLARLDRFEHHPFFYRRATIPLADGSPAEAYLMPSPAVAGYPVIASGDWRRRAQSGAPSIER